MCPKSFFSRALNHCSVEPLIIVLSSPKSVCLARHSWILTRHQLRLLCCGLSWDIEVGGAKVEGTRKRV